MKIGIFFSENIPHNKIGERAIKLREVIFREITEGRWQKESTKNTGLILPRQFHLLVLSILHQKDHFLYFDNHLNHL